MERVISIAAAETHAFARLSGDWNPLHVDPVEARRTSFGCNVVHGIHGVVCVIEAVLAETKIQDHSERIVGLRASFPAPIFNGVPFNIQISPRTGVKQVVQIECEGVTRQRIELTWGPPPNRPPPSPPPQWQDTPLALSFEQAAEFEGQTTTAIDVTALKALFPLLAAFDPALAAELCAVTRIVGMQVPGRQSIFSTLVWQRRDAETVDDRLSVRVVLADPRFSRIDIAIAGPGIAGTLRTFYRPEPVRQPGCGELSKVVPHGQFTGRRALVIGGVRGLGEVIAKMLTCGGAEVVATYRVGRKDGVALVDDCAAAGFRCDIASFDILAPQSLRAQLPDGWHPTHIYYMATPTIQGGGKRYWNTELFATYCRYYIEGFLTCIDHIIDDLQMKGMPLKIIQPSTIFLDQPEPAFIEYAAAKAAAETLSARISAQYPSITCCLPRISRVLTDQTNPIIAVETEEIVDMARNIIGY